MTVIQITEPPLATKRKNVCAYARVSSQKDVAQSSFDTQVRTYTEMITINPAWSFAGVYADEGKSGTNTVNRTQFQLMMEVAKMGKIDLILTKSISRFARNVVDCLEAIRLLKTYGTEVFFENENISSFDAKIEFVISILAGMAEEEARNVSENMKWSIKRRFEKGEGNVVTTRLLGYDTDNEGNLIINPYEAEIVRMIFRMYIFGTSVTQIKKSLEDRGVKTFTGKTQWTKGVIHFILSNDIYTGTLTLQKTFRPDFHSKHDKLNRGERNKYVVEDSHPAIITKADYEFVQRIKQSRIPASKAKPAYNPIKSEYTGKFICGVCGKNYRLKVNNRSSANPTQTLLCANNRDRKDCQSDAIFCDVADVVIRRQLELVMKNQKAFLDALRERYRTDPMMIRDQAELAALNARIAATKADVASLKQKGDSIAIDLAHEYAMKILELDLERIRIENEFLTIYNFENRIEKFRQIFKKEKLEFKDVFDHVLVISRDRWIFCLDKPQGIEHQDRKVIETLSGQHEYKIRSTRNYIRFSIEF